jgi:hypothetical protein
MMVRYVRCGVTVSHGEYQFPSSLAQFYRRIIIAYQKMLTLTRIYIRADSFLKILVGKTCRMSTCGQNMDGRIILKWFLGCQNVHWLVV